jgi:hypothetical protein
MTAKRWLALSTFVFAGCWKSRESPSTVTQGQPSVETRARALGPNATWDWNGVIGTGQSLSVGAQARQVVMTTQPFQNLKLSLGAANVTTPPYDAATPGLSLVPLVEPIRPEVTIYPGAYPLNIYGETPHTAMGNQISALTARSTGGEYVTVHTVVGESGQGIHVIDKGAVATPNLGHAYAAALFEVSAIERLATLSGKTYGVGAIVLTHGETDGTDENYEDDVARLRGDLDADIRAVTGQTTPIPLLLTQQQTCPGDNSSAASLIAEWKSGVDHEGEIICVGPKYQYPYASDRLHLVARGYDELGEKYGEVYYERVVLGHRWQPLQPVRVNRKDRVVTVEFHVPVAPLVWGDETPAPHQAAHTRWSNGRGFEAQNRDGELTIDSVAIRGNSVLITLASDPTPTDLVVRYAVTQDESGMRGGLATGRIGQLRDSDPLIGYGTKSPQYNWAVSFALPVK